MAEALIFNIVAAMGSAGTYAGHEYRRTISVPTRSAILGLLGAALGIDRADHENQTELCKYKMGVRAWSKKVHLRDYHTVQSVPSTIKNPSTRRTALEKAGLKTVTSITKRDYWMNALFVVAVSSDGSCRWPLKHLEKILLYPEYVLYLGRKSCPLCAPLSPTIKQGCDIVDALKEPLQLKWPKMPHEPGFIYTDPIANRSPDIVESMPVEPVNRSDWTFSRCDRWIFKSESANE